MSNFKKLYNEKLKGQIQKELGFENVMQVPRLDKIVLNVGLGEALQNGKLIESSVEQLRLITGQMPVVTKAKKSIANLPTSSASRHFRSQPTCTVAQEQFKPLFLNI